jgi:hypothetical protein
MPALPARVLTDEERGHARRALLASGIAAPELCERALQRCVLVPFEAQPGRVRGPRSLIAYFALASRASGITLGTQVYIQRQLFGPAMQLDLTLVVHEVTHVVQYLRDGHLTFLARYLRDYADGLRRGLADYDAYLAIPYEVEARAVASHLHGS